MEVALDNIRQAEGITTDLQQLKDILEERINLTVIVGKEKRVILTGNKVMRIALFAGLGQAEKLSLDGL